ncbi:hypothetical protein F5880DRAFT_1593346 [Lentinula raphanica]|nr:hypothetical protein F5880DRAFT_1593346 [Lentinula raphanica]
MHDVGDLGSVLARFSSLQVLYLEYAFEQLEFGSGDKMPLVQRTDHTGSAFDGLSRAESGLLLFASRLAKQIQTLDLIYIHEDGYDLPAKFGFLKDGFMYSIAIGMSVEHPNGVFIPDDEFLSEGVFLGPQIFHKDVYEHYEIVRLRKEGVIYSCTNLWRIPGFYSCSHNECDLSPATIVQPSELFSRPRKSCKNFCEGKDSLIPMFDCMYSTVRITVQII